MNAYSTTTYQHHGRILMLIVTQIKIKATDDDEKKEKREKVDISYQSFLRFCFDFLFIFF
jgi:hypothetical protein